MATYRIFDTEPPNFAPSTFFQAGAVRQSATSDEVVYANPDGSLIRIEGAALAFDGDGIATGGTVATITATDAAGAVTFASFTGLAQGFAALYGAWLGPTPGDIYALLLSGDDTLIGSEGGDALNGYSGNDTLLGGGGDDNLVGGPGGDVLDGGTGNDFAAYALDAPSGVTVDLALGKAADPYGSTDILVSIEQTGRTSHDDVLYGDDGPNNFAWFPFGGFDTIDGRGGIDTVSFFAFYWQSGGPAVAPDGSATFGSTTMHNIETVILSDASIDINVVSAVPDTITHTEGNAGTTGYSFTVSRTGLTNHSVNLNWSVAGSAGPGVMAAESADFPGGAFPTGTVTIDAGKTDATFVVPVAAEALGELNERFAVTLSPVSPGVAVGDAPSYGIILNDDISLAVTSPLVFTNEGTGTSRSAVIGVTRAGTLASSTTVDWSVAGSGSHPTDAGDFLPGTPPSGSLTFAAGQSNLTVTLGIATDTLAEDDESFVFTLANPSGGATLAAPTSTWTLMNDDGTRFSLLFDSPVYAPEGTGTSSTHSFTVQRTGDTTGTQQVGWQTSAWDATISAEDFVGAAWPSGTLTFAPGETSRTIDVAIAGDALVEPSTEGYYVKIASSAPHVTIGNDYAVGWIYDDDAAVSVAALKADRPEGRSGTTAFTFTVTRRGDEVVAPHGVSWSVTGVTDPAGLPAQPSDFVGGIYPSGTIEFASFVNSATITVDVTGNVTPQADRYFAVTLADPMPGTVLETASASGVIRDDDAATISVTGSGGAHAEGTGGTTPFTFTVSRAGNLDVAHNVAWSIAGAAAPGTLPADAADFAGAVFPSGNLGFDPGEATRTITVAVAADATGEANEQFALNLSAPTNGAMLGTASAQAVILNDDSHFSLFAETPGQPEGSGRTTEYVFRVVRNGDRGAEQSVDWLVGGSSGVGTGPADAADFLGNALPSGTLVFAPGEASRTFTVSVAGDSNGELNERFAASLSNPTGGASLGRITAESVIFNDDSHFSLFAQDAFKPEGTGSATEFVFRVARVGDFAVAQAVDWAVSGIAGIGTIPADAADFVGGSLPAGTLSFAPGEASRMLTVAVAADSHGEFNERFAVALSNPTAGAGLGRVSAQGVILDDDTVASTAADEALVGTDASELFLLGGGVDTVLAKGGTDLFRFLPTALGPTATTAVTLEDFSRADGERLDLARIDAVAGTLPDDPFVFTGTQGLVGMAGQLRWEDTGALRMIQGDVDGDAVADLTLFTSADGPVTVDWFRL